MRFIGNKTNLLNDIQKVIKENCDGSEKVFCDLFSGTSSVARFFKNEYKIISNDMLYFSYVLQKATIQNNQIPEFKKVKIALNIKDVFDVSKLNENKYYFYIPKKYLFVENYILCDFILD